MEIFETDKHPKTASTDWEPPIRIGDASSYAKDSKDSFEPFDQHILCPKCYHELLLHISPIHLQIEIDCPRCLAPLSGLIREHITQQNKPAPSFLDT